MVNYSIRGLWGLFIGKNYIGALWELFFEKIILDDFGDFLLLNSMVF